MEGFALKASIPSLKIVKTIKVFREDKVYETFGQIMKKVHFLFSFFFKKKITN